MRGVTRVAALLAIASVASSALGAQAAPDTSAFCFRGGPLDRCRAFALSELGYYFRVVGTAATVRFRVNGADAGTLERPSLERHLTWDLGAMVNRTPRSAVGGSVLIGFDRLGARGGAKGRYRRWLGSAAAVDVGGGIVSAVVRTARDGAEFSEPAVGVRTTLVTTRALGLTAEAHLDLGDLLAVGARADVMRTGGTTPAALYVGARGGSWVALGASFLVGLGAALAYGTVGSPGW